MSTRMFLVLFSLVALLAVESKGSAQQYNFTKQQLEQLASPIALYPDPLLQQVLAASTFPDQITDAALLIRTKSDAELIQDMSWDPSVKAIATYPGVLKMMYEKLDWTSNLGNAFLEQPKELLAAIQILRAKAQSVGNLSSSEQQKVIEQKIEGDTYITIMPSNPQVIYVPQQTTPVVYSAPVSNPANFWVPVATFGLGLAIGSAISNNNSNNYYYYGSPWRGPMWGYNSSYNHWVDRRYDTINRGLDYRHDTANKAIDTRRARNEDIHDRKMDRQDARQNYVKNNPDKINKQQWDSNAAQRQQKLESSKSNFSNRSVMNAQPSTRTTSQGWSGNGGSQFAKTASSRGAASRSSASSFSRSGSGVHRTGGGGGRRR